jgi:nucleotide-binding universal stress UspA family protein
MPSFKAETRESLMRIMVATDFSPGAQLALERALLLPRAGNATVHVVHVLSPNLPAQARDRATSEAKRALEKIFSRAQAQASARSLTLTMEILSGEPFVEIIRCSRNVNADLIVLGRHGQRPIQDMFIGTTAERVIRKGDVPILAVQLNPTHPYRRPLIATDLGDTAPRVFELALRMLEPTVNAVYVVHAFNVPFEGFVAPTFGAREKSDYRRSFRDAAKVGVAKLLARYGDTGVRYHATIRAGDARSLILTEVLRRRADLVVLGTHGRSGIAHALVGSVAEWVISQAPCDVLVARPIRFSFELP